MDIVNIQAQLEQIGMTKREGVVYLYLLTNGPSSPTEVARKNGIKRPNVYDIVEGLIGKGLVHYQLVSKRRLLVASSPAQLRDIPKQQIDLVENVLPALMSLDTERSFQGNIRFYQGRKAMQELYEDALNCKDKEAWYLSTPKDLNKIFGEDFIESFIKRRLKKGIKIRSLRPAEKESLYENQTSTEYGKQMTEVAYVPPEYT